MNKFLAKIFGYGIILLIISFFVGSAILMAVWNYTIPRIAHSTVTNYDIDKDFSPIDYPTAMVFYILLFMFFGKTGTYFKYNEYEFKL